jgi:glycosyltransferase involved in cell wall biosynthesis
MISVVIPVFNQIVLTDLLLSYISVNVVKPLEIILVDDNSTENIASLVPKYKDLNIVYSRQRKNWGVNSAWNVGIRAAKGDLISILNNDIIISKFFFKYVQKVMDDNPNIGICYPATIGKKSLILQADKEPQIAIEVSGYREGWAFTIRSKIAKDCYPIPPELRMFCGDDYLFESTRKRKFEVVRMLTNPVYHYTSVTLSASLGSKTDTILEEEKKLWNKIKNEMKG